MKKKLKMLKNRLGAVCVVGVLLSSCASRVFFISQEVSSIYVFKYSDSGTISDKVFVNDKEIIFRLCNHLNNSSKAFGKVRIEYAMILFYQNATSDTIYMNEAAYKSRKTGTREMNASISESLESLIASKQPSMIR